MHDVDLHGPAGAMLATAAVVVVAAWAARLSNRAGVPTLLVFLGLGFLLGSDVTGWVQLSDPRVAESAGVVALVVILFEGGLQSPPGSLRRNLRASLRLATIGTFVTAGVVAMAARLVTGLDWHESLLLGAIVSSTDAAAVFAALRGQRLRGEVGHVLEAESGFNDPMAVLLTVVLLGMVVDPGGDGPWDIAWFAVRQFGLGVAIGIAGGFVTRWLLQRFKLPDGSLVALLVLACGVAVYGGTALLDGSGFLAVYLAGIVVARGDVPFRPAVLGVAASMAWLMQIAMFVVLGLFAEPGETAGVILPGLGVAAVLILVARPVGVLVALVPSRLTWRERAFTSWVGLRGAVPIVLATFPLLAGAPHAAKIFDVVVVVVVVSALVQGTTVSVAARLLGLAGPAEPEPEVTLELGTLHDVGADLRRILVADDAPAAGLPLHELQLPEGVLVSAIVRGPDLVVPHGTTVLEGGDVVYVLTRTEHAADAEAPFVGLVGPVEDPAD